MNTDGNNATAYGVTIQRTQPDANGLAWRCEEVQHLSPGENGGNHHVYCDVFDLYGRELRGSTAICIGWDWEGRHGDEEKAKFEKDTAPGVGHVYLPVMWEKMEAWFGKYMQPSP